MTGCILVGLMMEDQHMLLDPRGIPLTLHIPRSFLLTSFQMTELLFLFRLVHILQTHIPFRPTLLLRPLRKRLTTEILIRPSRPPLEILHRLPHLTLPPLPRPTMLIAKRHAQKRMRLSTFRITQVPPRFVRPREIRICIMETLE